MKKQPRFYFSLRSPYSWYAYRDLAERHPDVLDAVRWTPYWEPDPDFEAALRARGAELPVVPMSRAKSFYILADTRRMFRARGWSISWPIDRAPHWEHAHLGYLVAADAGLGRSYVEEVSRMRWERNRDISDPATVSDVGRLLGLDLDGVIAREDIRERGLECLLDAYRDDAFGVPFFVAGREKFWGAERVDLFAAAVRGSGRVIEVAAPSDGAELVKAGADAGHAGGCG